jgi:chloramphenicol 3-O-phosphotransferase
MKPVIIISGPVGAGKSTVARELIAISAGPVAYIEGDKFWSFIAKGSTEKNARFNNFKMIMASMTASAIPYSRAGYEVILDFSIPPWFLDAVRKILITKDIPVHFVVLKPAKNICATRAAAREEGKIDDYKLYGDLYASFTDVEKFTIHNDDKDPAIVAGFIREGVDSGAFRLL